MAVKIRFARFGCRNRPFYRIVAADDKSRRDGKQIEVLGHYNPLPGKDDDKRMGLKLERIKYWLSVGAQPSEPVHRILVRAGVLPPVHLMGAGSHNTHPIDPLSGCYATPNENDANENALSLGNNSNLWCHIGVQVSESDFSNHGSLQDSVQH